MQNSKRLRGISPYSLTLVAFFAAIVIAIIWVFRDYSITWDEEVHKTYGDLALYYYGTLFKNKLAANYLDLKNYGALFDMTAQLVVHAAERIGFGDSPMEVRHLVNACFGLLGLWCVLRCGDQIFGQPAGLLAAACLLFTPAFVGHSFQNPKDIPFASLYMLSVWQTLRLRKSLPDLPWRDVFLSGGAIGLALGARIGALLLFFYIGLALIIPAGKSARDHAVDLWRRKWRIVSIPGVAWLVMLACWPYAQQHPIQNPMKSLQLMSAFSWNEPVLFGGDLIRATQLPSSYLPTWFLLTLPEHYFVIGGLGLIFLCWNLIRKRKQASKSAGKHESTLSAIVLAAAITLPVASAIALRSTVYDGLRHFLFTLPPMAVLAGWIVSCFFHEANSRLWRGIVVTIFLALLTPAALGLWRYHPFQAIYFNTLFAGGMPGVAGRFETDYWGVTDRAGALWVKDHYPKGTRIVACSNPEQVDYYLNHQDYIKRYRFFTAALSGAGDIPKLLEQASTLNQEYPIVRMDQPDRPADVLLATTRFNCHKSRKGVVRHTIELESVPLLYVIDLTPPEKVSR